MTPVTRSHQAGYRPTNKAPPLRSFMVVGRGYENRQPQTSCRGGAGIRQTATHPRQLYCSASRRARVAHLDTGKHRSMASGSAATVAAQTSSLRGPLVLLVLRTDFSDPFPGPNAPLLSLVARIRAFRSIFVGSRFVRYACHESAASWEPSAMVTSLDEFFTEHLPLGRVAAQRL